MKRYTIGVLIGNANSPHTKALMRGIHNAAEKMNVNVIFFLGVHMAYYYRAYFGDGIENTYDYQYNTVYDYARMAQLDALIISYGSIGIFLENKDKQHFLNRFREIPYVLLEDRDETGKGTTIISDNYNGMFRMVEHLLQVHKYRRFVYLSGPKNNTDSEERKQAFIDAMKKYGITVREDMFADGDFSECVEEQVNMLLNSHPNAQAIVCANDVMAETAYHVCARRGLTVGKDIAVTGYDDWNMAESMTPPLTTVLQNEFDMGYTAMKRAIELCQGEEPLDLLAPAVLKIRGSCGCSGASNFDFSSHPYQHQAKDNSAYIENVVKAMSSRILLSNVSEEIRTAVAEKLRRIMEENMRFYQSGQFSKFDKETLMTRMNELIAGKYGRYISPVSMAEGVSDYLGSVIKHEKDVNKIGILSEILASVQKYIQTSVIKLNKDDFDDFQQDAMFMPLMTRDMMNNIGNEKEFYEAPMKILAALCSRATYLFILEKPILHQCGEDWKKPERIFLASYHEGKKIVSYEPSERPVINKRKALTEIFDRESQYAMSVFDLFLGQLQFGILVSEIEPQDMILLHLASLQISTALNFQVLYAKQVMMKQKLEILVEEVNEKNKVLGFISEYDELTGCLNRRGFMEKAVTFIHKNQGVKAVVILSDLDHLKEINDCFGHVAGDFAIKQATEILKAAVGKDTLVARIGGDEFIAILPYVPDQGGKLCVSRIREQGRIFNEQSDKEYYVEISAGYTEFICDPARNFNSIMSDADLMLYEAKKSRRSTIRKNI